MYRVYAHDPQARINLGIRRRLAPLLGNDRRAHRADERRCCFSLPGTPVLYYGDEIGMGDNIYLGDRNGVRTPMQWSADRNAGFSRANPQRLYLPVIIDPEYHYEAVNVEAQQNNPHSLLWWMKRLIALRKRLPARSAAARIEFLRPREPQGARVRAPATRTRRILVVANLSRFVQYVELDLSAFRGRDAGRAVRRTRVPADRRAAVPPDARPARASTGSRSTPRGRDGRRAPDAAEAAARSTSRRVGDAARRPGRAALERAAARATSRRGAGSAARRGAIAGAAIVDGRCPMPAPTARPRLLLVRRRLRARASRRRTSLPLAFARPASRRRRSRRPAARRDRRLRRAASGEPTGVLVRRDRPTPAFGDARCSTSIAPPAALARPTTASSSAGARPALRRAARRRRRRAAAVDRSAASRATPRSSSATGSSSSSSAGSRRASTPSSRSAASSPSGAAFPHTPAGRRRARVPPRPAASR